MKIKYFYITASFACLFMLTSCVDYEVKDPNFMPPDVVLDEGDDDEIIEGLPTPGEMQAYSPSLLGKPYRPIKVKYSSQFPPVASWTEANTRIVAYMGEYKPSIKTESDYKAITNKYGSLTTGAKQQATGRFYVKKVNGRWWIIDPEGYPHYERSVTSLRYGSSSRNKEAWNKRFGNDNMWLSKTQAELASIGFHGTGAFCTNTYSKIQAHNQSNPNAPMTLAPSFGFLSQFRSQNGHAYPGNTSDNELGLVLYSDWADFCKSYIRSAMASYLNDANVLGFFSDNEINFSSQNSRILDRFLKLTDRTDIAYLEAKKFMEEKNATSVTDNLNSEFAGRLAELYYKGVKEAIKEIDPGMMYLGTRLHGTPKYLQHVVAAAGKYCDIISINYYSRWSPELTTYVKQWGEDWADAPFMVTEFYTKGVEDSDLNNQSGAGFSVPTQNDRAYAYQHFTLGLLEAKNCVGWHWFKYQDDDGTDNSSKPANKGVYDNYYEMYPYLSKFMKEVNYNVYNLIEYFDK